MTATVAVVAPFAVALSTITTGSVQGTTGPGRQLVADDRPSGKSRDEYLRKGPLVRRHVRGAASPFSPTRAAVTSSICKELCLTLRGGRPRGKFFGAKG